MPDWPRALRAHLGTIALGDLAYPEGTLRQLRTWFGPSFGRLGDRVRPVPGNHEYRSGATGYFDFFNGEGMANGRAGERGRGKADEADQPQLGRHRRRQRHRKRHRRQPHQPHVQPQPGRARRAQRQDPQRPGDQRSARAARRQHQRERAHPGPVLLHQRAAVPDHQRQEVFALRQRLVPLDDE